MPTILGVNFAGGDAWGDSSPGNKAGQICGKNSLRNSWAIFLKFARPK